MEFININYSGGYMNINLETFFPTSQSNFNKLIKVIDMDWQNRDKHIQAIKSWCADEIKLCEEKAKEYANKYVDIKPKVREAEVRVREKEHYINTFRSDLRAFGYYNSYMNALKEARKEYREIKSLERSYNSSFKHYHNRKEKLQRNLGVLQ